MTDDQQARHSAAWMTFFYIITILSWLPIVVLFLLQDTHLIAFAFFLSIMAGSFLAGSVNLLNWRDMLHLMFDEDEPPNLGPPQREPRTIVVNSANVPDRARLEMVADQTIHLGGQDLTRGEWRRLTVALRDNTSGSYNWSRRVLPSDIFPSLTIGQNYNDLTWEFEQVGALKVYRNKAGVITRAHVTNDGIEALHKAAGMKVVTS